MRLRNKLLTASCVAAAMAALATGISCNEHEISPFAQSLSAGQKQTLSSGSTRPVDILFIVDNSSSMVEEQRGLDENFKTFLAQLTMAGADYRLAAVNTSYAPGNPFQVAAPWTGNQVNQQVEEALRGVDLNALKQKCSNYFSNHDPWISSTDMVGSDGSISASGTPLGDEANLSLLVDLFRCEAIGGTNGASVERGLATMSAALTNPNFKFKRDGSILAIVFVTDENDCTENEKLSISDKQPKECEIKRNIEDSCAVTKYDAIITQKSNDVIVSALKPAAGQLVTIGAQKTVTDSAGKTYEIGNHTLRELCLAGDDAARAILTACLENEKDCSVSQDIKCPAGGCTNELQRRKDFYDEVINLVASSNRAQYEQQNKSIYDNAASDADKQAIRNDLARQDVIVANIINRDIGKRYTTDFNDRWCANSGSQGYRYQLFAEMFNNDPIFAPICCQAKQDEFLASYKEQDAEGSLVTKSLAVCNSVPSAEDEGNSEFGPVLGAIGQRIGEAVNTVCTDSVPVTCNPSDCNGAKPNASCPCNYGCNETVYLSQNEHEYHLCNEFVLNVGVVDSRITDPAKIAENYKQYTAGNEYSVNFESQYCLTRTGSPIQINLNKNEPNTSLVIEYPKKVSSI